MSDDGESVAIPTPLSAHARYRLENLTRHVTLSSAAMAACTFWRRLAGLLGRRSMAVDEALIFPECRSVHTWFMRMPIDVMAIGRDGAVLHCAACVRPWRMVWPVPGAWAIVELAPGAIRTSGTAVGDRLALTPFTQSP